SLLFPPRTYLGCAGLKADDPKASLIANTNNCALTSSNPDTNTPLVPADFNCCAAFVTSASAAVAATETPFPVTMLYIFTKASFCSATVKGIRLSAFAPDKDIFASIWICLDILPFLGIRPLAYSLSYPPPCQSPRKSAPTE